MKNEGLPLKISESRMFKKKKKGNTSQGKYQRAESKGTTSYWHAGPALH